MNILICIWCSSWPILKSYFISWMNIVQKYACTYQHGSGHDISHGQTSQKPVTWRINQGIHTALGFLSSAEKALQDNCHDGFDPDFTKTGHFVLTLGNISNCYLLFHTSVIFSHLTHWMHNYHTCILNHQDYAVVYNTTEKEEENNTYSNKKIAIAYLLPGHPWDQ